MHVVAEYLAYALICPVALLYIFLLNDQWRITRCGKALLLAGGGLLPLCLPGLLPVHGTWLGLFLVIPWLVLLPILWWASRVRDARFLFVVLSAMLFTYLSNTVADKLAYDFHLSALLLRVVFDGVLLFFCLRFYRPVFRAVLRATHSGWPMLCLLPLAIWGAYLTLLSYPNYFQRSMLPQVQFFVIALLLIALLLYAVTFSFFQKLRIWHEYEVDMALLDVQLEEFDRRLRHQQAATERSRILRHDLRHYLPLLSERLRAGELGEAREILEAMRALTAEDWGEGEAPS